MSNNKAMKMKLQKSSPILAFQEVVELIKVSLSVWMIVGSVVGVKSADPDPVFDLNPYADSYALRDIFINGDVVVDIGGVRAATTTPNFLGQLSQGLTLVRFKLFPCGVNLPHSHPRASEILTLVSGGPLQAGFVDTEGEAHLSILWPGDVIIFPRGLLHYEINVGNVMADYVSSLNSENPGQLMAGGSLFQIPLRALSTTLNQNPNIIHSINKTLYAYDIGLKKASNSFCIPGMDVSTKY